MQQGGGGGDTNNGVFGSVKFKGAKRGIPTTAEKLIILLNVNNNNGF